MEILNNQEIEYSIAKERVRQLKKFYASLLIFIVLIAFFGFRKYYKTGEINFLEFNNYSVIFWIWGIILAVKAVKIFLFNHSWERKMMERELNK